MAAQARRYCRAALLAASLTAIPTLTAHAHSQQEECLAKAIYHEARGQGLRGQLAVAQVVLNRTQDPRFPKTVCAVIYQRDKWRCQFSWVCRGNRIQNAEQWQRAKRVAAIALNGMPDQTGNALYFHAKWAKPNWSGLRRVAYIDGHFFYVHR